MPIDFDIDHDQRLVTATASAVVEVEAFVHYLEDICARGVKPYRKLFDMRFAEVTLNAADIRRLAAIVAGMAEADRLGPLAIVATADYHVYMAEWFGQRSTAAQRPLAIFDDPAKAGAWLMSRD